MAARIPAWKKLGLQLKNSATSGSKRDTSLPVTANAPSPSKITKKRPLSSGNEEPNGKKQRFESAAMSDETKREDPKRNAKWKAQNPEIKSSIGLSSTEQPKDKPASKPKSKKRKSVSFAPDTKSEDEDAELELELEHEGGDEHEPSPAAARKAEKKKLKQEQRAKNRPAPTSPSNPKPTPAHPVLQYLTLYYKSRAQWKFQKNRETHLLKHALSVDRIPSTYNAALAAYLAGIKGEAAKRRVAEAAVEAIKADDADIDSEKNGGDDVSEKDGYRNATISFRRKLREQGADPDGWGGEVVGDGATDLNDDWLKKLEKRKRAELILHCVGGSVPTTEAAHSQPKPLAKTRKNRTAVVEDTSSSSSSDSDSDSDNDSSSESDSDNANSRSTIKQVNGTKDELHRGASSSPSSSDSDSEPETTSSSSSDSERRIAYPQLYTLATL
ncbi:hypothetical protein AJ78_02209 [Emergomyces pasteurianus Ep9510]|uniref:WKF domain-containing protein n=1 Tax=Emergomyces pasteurianus Ep9510 TaxID=1447872 RepID=A0A1J9QNI5_9EURO|nr:hypothetical protein AJ78_02209 [Emergomyces pasteurianus Ep9510]